MNEDVICVISVGQGGEGHTEHEAGMRVYQSRRCRLRVIWRSLTEWDSDGPQMREDG